MVRIVAFAAQGILLGFLVYELLVALWGWRRPRLALPGARATRFRVLVPAHDEAAVLPGLLADLARQDYPDELVRVVVIADRCTDDTVAIAAAHAEVAERVDGAPGKGAALDWHLQASPAEADEAIVVFDADNRVPPQTLGRLADELSAGHTVLQSYLDVENPDGSLLATASALSYWAGNRMVQLARHNLGWSADLGGTGMCFSPTALGDLGGFGTGVTEDQGALAALVVAGHRVRWLHDVRLRDEKPEGVRVAITQRARWVRGKRAVARQWVGKLLRAAGSQRSWAPVDVAIRLIQPGRSFLVLLAAVLALASGVTGSDVLLPWWLWTVAASVWFLAPMVFLIREGVPARYIARYPALALLALLWLPIRVASRVGKGGWRRTPRRAEQP